MFRNPRTNTTWYHSVVLLDRKFCLSVPQVGWILARPGTHIPVDMPLYPPIQTTKLHPARQTDTYTWNRLHFHCCELSGRVAAATKGRGRRDSGARFDRCSHRHDIVRGARNWSGVHARVEVLIERETNFEIERGRGRDLGKRARENGMWLIKDAVLNLGRSEDWLVSAAAIDPQQEKDGRRSTAMQAMQAMQCNVMCDDGEAQLSVQVGMHLSYWGRVLSTSFWKWGCVCVCVYMAMRRRCLRRDKRYGTRGAGQGRAGGQVWQPVS